MMGAGSSRSELAAEAKSGSKAHTKVVKLRTAKRKWKIVTRTGHNTHKRELTDRDIESRAVS